MKSTRRLYPSNAALGYQWFLLSIKEFKG